MCTQDGLHFESLPCLGIQETTWTRKGPWQVSSNATGPDNTNAREVSELNIGIRGIQRSEATSYEAFGCRSLPACAASYEPRGSSRSSKPQALTPKQQAASPVDFRVHKGQGERHEGNVLPAPLHVLTELGLAACVPVLLRGPGDLVSRL